MGRIGQQRWEKCPECSSLGSIDDEQYRGLVSIRCTECGHHYTRASEDLEDQVEKIESEK